MTDLDFDLENYLTAMEERLTHRLNSIDDKLNELPELKTRLALVEQVNGTLVKGVWGLVVSFVGAAFTWLFKELPSIKGH